MTKKTQPTVTNVNGKGTKVHTPFYLLFVMPQKRSGMAGRVLSGKGEVERGTQHTDVSMFTRATLCTARSSPSCGVRLFVRLSLTRRYSVRRAKPIL